MLLRFAFLILLAAGPQEPRMSWLDNGTVRIGLDLSRGGAVTFLEAKARPGNLINSHDLGRQIQMSHYSGPVPYEVGEKKPHPAWKGLGWNPIQTGDCRGRPSRVVDHRNDGKEIYVKCVPMQWPLDDVPADCTFETWTALDGPVVRMRYRLVNARSDRTLYAARPQELPAVYTIARLHRLMAYTGDRPFAGGDLTHVKNDATKAWPWTEFRATERWAALVGDDDWGLGVCKDDGAVFHGGLWGKPGASDPADSSTGYVAPIHVETLDADIVYEHRTEFMLGTLAEIRKRFTERATRKPPAWTFEADRQHWHVRDGVDAGWPLKGTWRIRSGSKKPRLVGPDVGWRAEEAKTVWVEMSCRGKGGAARLYWSRLDAPGWDAARSAAFEVVADGEMRTYRVDLSASAEYRGLILGLALEPLPEAREGEEAAVRSITLH